MLQLDICVFLTTNMESIISKRITMITGTHVFHQYNQMEILVPCDWEVYGINQRKQLLALCYASPGIFIYGEIGTIYQTRHCKSWLI